MKKVTLLLLAAITTSLSVFAQPSKWFVSVSSGYPFGGPLQSIKNNMKKSGLDASIFIPGGSFFGWEVLPKMIEYPKGKQQAPLLLKAGKKIDHHRSLFFSGGVSNVGEAQGHAPGTVDTAGYTSYGSSLLNVKFRVLQFTGGYEYSFPHTRAKVAIGPSLFLLRYKSTDGMIVNERHTAFAPGVATSARLPLGKEKHLFGIDLVAELNLAVPAKMKTLSSGNDIYNQHDLAVLKSGTVNMVHGMLGLACSFRRK